MDFFHSITGENLELILDLLDDDEGDVSVALEQEKQQVRGIIRCFFLLLENTK